MKKKFDKKKLHKLYMEIWLERQVRGRNYSEVSGELLPKEPSSLNFEHLLEKNQYPDLIFERSNIILVTAEEQELRSKGHPKPKHKELINKAKIDLL